MDGQLLQPVFPEIPQIEQRKLRVEIPFHRRVLLSDRFGGASRWTAVSGTWAIENGEYSQSDTAAVAHYAVAGRLTWNDYVFQSKIRWLGAAEGFFGIITRYTNVNNFYHLRLAAGFVSLYRWVGGVATQLLVRPWASPVGVPFTLKMEVQGPMIRCYVDDILLGKVIDTNLRAGMVGFRSHTGHHHFDDALAHELGVYV